MKMFSDISGLIFALNDEQRDEFSKFIEKMKADGVDKKLSQFSEFTCEQILEEIDSTTSFEKMQKEKEKAVEKSKTTIPKEKHGVHETHCCIKHGCKYGDIDCPVVLGIIKQRYLCESCSWDVQGKNQSLESITKIFLKENRKIKLNEIKNG